MARTAMGANAKAQMILPHSGFAEIIALTPHNQNRMARPFHVSEGLVISSTPTMRRRRR